jgi:hypothetical protein
MGLFDDLGHYETFLSQKAEKFRDLPQIYDFHICFQLVERVFSPDFKVSSVKILQKPSKFGEIPFF